MTSPPDDTLNEAMRRVLHAVAAGELEQVRRALDAVPALVNMLGPHPFWDGRPQPLHVAIESNRHEMFELLLERGADVNGSNQDYARWSPLLLAAHNGCTEMTRALIDRGARIGLAEALALGDDARVDALLDREGTLETPMPSDATPLHFARTPHAVDRLLALGVSAERANRWGTTAIEALSRCGPASRELLGRLAAHGVPLGAAGLARIGDQAALERLAQQDASALHAPRVLHAAAEAGAPELVRWLVAAGCDVNGRAGGAADETPLHRAAWNGDLAMVRLLLELGADPSARDRRHDADPHGWALASIGVTRNPRCAEVAEYLRSRTGAS